MPIINRSNSPRGPRNGSAVETLKQRKLVADIFISSGWMLIYTLIFSIFGLIFIIDAISGWVKILIGIFFILPVFILVFSRGRSVGERDYKLKNNSILSDIHAQRIAKVNPLKALLHVVPFFGITFVLILVGVAARVQWLQGLLLMVYIPTTLLFMGVGALDISTVGWMAFGSVIIMAFITSAAFVVGYTIGVLSMKRRAEELVNEIRSYE